LNLECFRRNTRPDGSIVVAGELGVILDGLLKQMMDLLKRRGGPLSQESLRFRPGRIKLFLHKTSGVAGDGLNSVHAKILVDPISMNHPAFECHGIPRGCV
jgi:hypothetical protein